MPDLQPFSWERMIRAVEKVRERLLLAAAALEAIGVPYAATGDNAVAAWVSRVDEAAVRNTRDVDFLVRRADFDRARAALEAAGFVYRHSAGIDMFLDGPDVAVRDAVHLVFAGEMVRPGDELPAPDVAESERANGYRVLSLDSLVRMELTSHRRNNRVNVRDLIDVGLVDESWLDRFPPVLAGRLKELLDSPDG